MNEPKKDIWYYVIVQTPETPEEQFLGYKDKKTGEPFIPAFTTKEIAQQCFLVLPKDVINEKYEVQAVIKEDLMASAQKNDYAVFLLDDKGRVLEEIS